MSEAETTIIRLPAKIRIEYEFWDPYKSEKETPTKFSINIKIFLTKDEAEMLDEELINIMLKALNKIFEARKLEQEMKAIKEAVEEVFDADPA
jgi:protoporphyrinogen oxidase